MAGSSAGNAVIVTGASSGIGRVMAVELARHGAKLWLVGRSQTELEETARRAGRRRMPPRLTSSSASP